MSIKSGFLEKLIARVDRVEPGEVQTFLERLVREKGFMEKVFDALQEGVIVVDTEGEVSYINRAACGFFGLDPEKIVGHRVHEAIRGLDWQSLVSRQRRVASRDLEVFQPEKRFLNFYLTPLGGDELSEEHLGFVMLIRDVTQTRKKTEEMIESERLGALTMLAAGVAHEIGNPLNSLNIHLQLMERKLKKASPDAYEELKESLEVSRGEIKRLDFIIEKFLGAIRPTQPRLELQDVNRLVAEAVKVLEPEIKDREIETILALGEGIPLLQLDGDQLKQAFYNLIRNACQAMSSGERLTISTEKDEYEVRICFADSGEGISEEHMSSIFEPYFTTKKSGTGLGLLIVSRIVREHGGELEVVSTEGEGTVVTLHLPLGQRAVRWIEPREQAEGVIDV